MLLRPSLQRVERAYTGVLSKLYGTVSGSSTDQKWGCQPLALALV
jgi:hypothetical protein